MLHQIQWTNYYSGYYMSIVGPPTKKKHPLTSKPCSGHRIGWVTKFGVTLVLEKPVQKLN